MNHDMEHDRAEAERHRCTYAMPAARKTDSKVCGAQPGERCRNPLTGYDLEHQAAHRERLIAAGRLPDPTRRAS